MKNRKIKLILILSTILLLFFTTINVVNYYLKITKSAEEAIANQNLKAAIAIASSINIETYEKFLEDPVENDYYWEIREFLNDARKKLGGVLIVYTLEIDNPYYSKTMVPGIPINAKEVYPIGEICTVPERQVQKAYEGLTYITDVIEDPKLGTYISVGAPIKNEEGKVLGYLGIDISTKTVNEIKMKVLENNIFNLVFNGVFILIVIVSFFFLQRWYQREVAKEVGYTENTYQSEIRTLITSVSSLRHDFTNHIQVLHGLLQLGEFDTAQAYLSSLSKEVKSIESLKINIDHPGLSILLQTKKLAAQNHYIDMNIKFSSFTTLNKVKTTDLIILLSNLIDNAIDATMELPEDQRKIDIIFQNTETTYIFKIINTGPNIVENELIFEHGYSTKKEDQGKIRGQGLFIVREVVQKYKGKISIESTGDQETTATLEIPK